MKLDLSTHIIEEAKKSIKPLLVANQIVISNFDNKITIEFKKDGNTIAGKYGLDISNGFITISELYIELDFDINS